MTEMWNLSDEVNDSRLVTLQSLQFDDRPVAESQLLDFVQEIFPELKPVEVELRPSAVSLNSINGFLRLEDGRRLFFKTHVEPDSVINEYYNSTLLAEVGYPIYQPLYASTEYGKQFLVYELVESPLLFDVVNMIESHRDSAASAEIDSLTAEQHAVDEKLWGI
ncbi:MAG: hypothetical protein ACREP9_21040, partial [Candidatus Dormibacteraceae bacterium]